MDMLLQTIITGISTGSIYAMVGLGLGVIYNVSKVVNLAQGEFLSLGAFVMVSLISIKVPVIIALPLTVFAMALAGLVFERLIVRPAWNAPHAALLIATVAASIIIKGIAVIVWGKDPLSIPSFSGEKPLVIGETIIATQTFWVAGSLILVAILCWYIFSRTLAGKAILAVSENRDAAALVGINISLAVQLSFALSAAVGALGGAVMAPITFASTEGGLMMGLKGFIALTIGGMENIWGGLLGGVILGLLETLGAGFISTQYKDLIAFALLIVVLYVRPNGILGLTSKKSLKG